MKVEHLLACLLVIATSSLHAQTSTFLYQGRLDDNGAPANGSYDLRFTLCSVSSGPGPVGSPITATAAVVSNGVFMATLDFGSLAFSGENRWLEISVRTNGSSAAFTTLAPRQAVTSVPYAITAAGLTGVIDTSQLYGSISAANIAPNTITADMLAAGSVTSSKLAAGSVTSTQLAAGSVNTSNLVDGAVTVNKIPTTLASFVAVTFTNPTPAALEEFGDSIAAVGTGKVLIGAPMDNKGASAAGVAHLFTTTGTLLVTITNPTPAFTDYFGDSVAAVGTEAVLIGAYQDDTGATNAGAAYLFSTNGTLLTTFTNPTPAASDSFGHSVAAFATDKVLIGADQDDTFATNAGAAYLFSTNGTLLTTFTNPTPAANDSFGFALAAVGADLVLIGAWYDDTGITDAGAAYLFRADGSLVMTITNPTPAFSDYFGYAVAAVGSDKFLIGTYVAGQAYLYATNGSLLTTFNNPTPANGDLFGSVVAAMGSDKVLIGAYQDDTGATNAGSAYLFGTNGTLLATFTNPAPTLDDHFGFVLAAAGTNQVLVGAFRDDAGALNAGVAYLLDLGGSYVQGLISEGVVERAITANDFDSSIGVWAKSGTNLYYNDGNIGIGTNVPQQKLHVIGNILASGTVTGSSDRNIKQDFVPVDSRTVLDKVLALPISTWGYIADPAVRHLGPMAQDFHSAFKVGMSDKHISMVDADGVALASIQGLNQKFDEILGQKDARIAQLEQRITALEALIKNRDR